MIRRPAPAQPRQSAGRPAPHPGWSGAGQDL